MRYYVIDYETGYILPNQPNEGYTELQACSRVIREREEVVKVLGKRFNITYNDTKDYFRIVDAKNLKIQEHLVNAC